MALSWGSPARVAAIDAGSNAIRLAIAEANTAADLTVIETERGAVRLGHGVFLEHRLDSPTMSRTLETFRRFRRLLDRFGVRSYRAVATSALREARNRKILLQRIRRQTGLRLEVIGPSEEARLVRHAVMKALDEGRPPRLIFDLGGGSLEISLLHAEGVERTLALPLGTVRLMESHGIRDRITPSQQRLIHDRVLASLVSALPDPPDLADGVVVGCGGNAEALARLTAGTPIHGVPVLQMGTLRRMLPEILRLDVRGRMKTFGVRPDRADVMAIAAIVLTTLAEWLRLRNVLVPGVGVREGLLLDLAGSLFRRRPSPAETRRAARLLADVRKFAASFHCDMRRAESTRRLAASIFDGLAPLHGLPADLRLLLELAATLYDIGRAVNPAGRQKHGEYLVRHGHLPGLAGPSRELVACLVRYHDAVEPELRHKLYSSFSPRERRQVRVLAALLRIAVALNAGSGPKIDSVQTKINPGTVTFLVPEGANLESRLRRVRARAGLFEQELERKTRFRRITQAGGGRGRRAHFV
ncbi:MAG TPA: Ppx/GppA phosphatase family protein [Patescibacteria group bacterium]|nr:Ppx/GppA phosphatase family protein [Patescibacteria group bacterium]